MLGSRSTERAFQKEDSTSSPGKSNPCKEEKTYGTANISKALLMKMIERLEHFVSGRTAATLPRLSIEGEQIGGRTGAKC